MGVKNQIMVFTFFAFSLRILMFVDLENRVTHSEGHLCPITMAEIKCN